MKWYLVIRRGTVPVTERRRAIEQHLAWMRDMHEQGTVLISGPSADRTMGLYVVRAPSRSDAEAIAHSDPLARRGESAIDVIEWNVHQMLGIGPFELDSLQRVEGVGPQSGSSRSS